MNIIVLLAEGFEEVEALTVVDYLRRMEELKVFTVSITEKLYVKGAHDITVKADKTFNQLRGQAHYDAIVIPGGMPGATNLRDDIRVIDFIKDVHKNEDLVAAICAGPIVLAEAGIIKDKNITSYPGFEDELSEGNYLESPVVLDGNILTARGPAIATDFAIEIIKYLLGEGRANDLMTDILY